LGLDPLTESFLTLMLFEGVYGMVLTGCRQGRVLTRIGASVRRMAPSYVRTKR